MSYDDQDNMFYDQDLPMKREEIQQEFEVNATMDVREIQFEPRKLARNTDPSTSKMAADRAGFLGLHHRKILKVLKDRSYAALTPYEIADRTFLEPAAVFRRLNELEKAGKIYKTGERRGPTGRMCRVWRAV